MDIQVPRPRSPIREAEKAQNKDSFVSVTNVKAHDSGEITESDDANLTMSDANFESPSQESNYKGTHNMIGNARPEVGAQFQYYTQQQPQRKWFV